MYLVSNDTMSTISKSNQCETCQKKEKKKKRKKKTNPLTNEKYMLVSIVN